MSENKRPNLFDFATSELSHDAFIAWLLCWSDPRYKSEMPHSLSKAILREFFKISGKETPGITSVEVKTQHKNIDVLVIVTDDEGQKWAVIIENKLFTREHSDQLSNYWGRIEESKTYDTIKHDQIVGIYYKMWEQSNLEKVYKSKFVHFDRQMMMHSIESNPSGSEIVNQYYQYLNRLQEELDAYKTETVSSWSSSQWTGFYSRLKQDLNDGDFGYVANPRGGFMGYWMGSQDIGDGMKIYVQSENNKLCVKLYARDKEFRQKAKNYWHRKLLKTAKQFGVNIVKPKVMRVGKWFTIGVLDTDENIPWKDEFENKPIDYDESLQILNSVIQVVESVSKYKADFKAKINSHFDKASI